MKFESGSYISGEFLGVKVVPKSNADGTKKWEEHYIGLSVPVTNGYAGQSATIDIRLSKSSVENREHEGFGHLVGKFALVPTNTMARAFKEKAYVTNFYDSRRQILLPYEQQSELKKVS